jgi:hypothetical protein
VGSGGRDLVGRELAAAGAQQIDRRRRGHPVQPRPQVPGVTEPRIRTQRAHERVLHDVLRVLVAGDAAGMHEQLVAVCLDEGPEGGQHIYGTWHGAGT